MDDTKRYTIQIKGVAYKFKPLDREGLSNFHLLDLMEVSPGVKTKAIFRILKETMDPDDWDALALRFFSKEVPLTELKVIIDRLLKKTQKDWKDAETDSSDDD